MPTAAFVTTSNKATAFQNFLCLLWMTSAKTPAMNSAMNGIAKANFRYAVAASAGKNSGRMAATTSGAEFPNQRAGLETHQAITATPDISASAGDDVHNSNTAPRYTANDRFPAKANRACAMPLAKATGLNLYTARRITSASAEPASSIRPTDQRRSGTR